MRLGTMGTEVRILSPRPIHRQLTLDFWYAAFSRVGDSEAV